MKERYYEECKDVIAQVNKVIIGKDECIRKVMAAILAGGHILIDDIPGVGKTTLAMAFARAMNLDSRRTQFTPDVMPSDILGFSMYSKEDGHFHYQDGTVMCNLFLADEINRTSPKTQSALLEVMEENSVTVDGVTRNVPEPFIVIATENPAGSIGTQLLPESQLDRFMICMSMGYPELEDEIAIAKGYSVSDTVDKVDAVIDGAELINIRAYINDIYIDEDIYTYICKLIQATRNHPLIELGVSPRGTIAMVKMVKAVAFLSGRDYALPDDVIEVFESVAEHRIILNSKARVTHVDVEKVLEQITDDIRKPSMRKSKR